MNSIEQIDREAGIAADQGAIDAARALSARDCGALQSEMRVARQKYLAEAFAAHRRTAQAELVSALERIDKMMRELRAIKSRPIANSGFSTGPALHFDQARRIALDARREVRATLSKYSTDGGV